MAEYYAVERSPEYLMHYGIKGMRWGVQKARYKGNEKALARQYSKAQKKLQKYKDKMNIDKQKEAYKYHHGKFMRSALATAGTSGIGVGGLLGSSAIYNKRLPSGFQQIFTYDAASGKTVRALTPVYDSASTKLPNALGALGAASGAVGVGLAAKSGYHAAKALAAQYRSSKKGHERTVKKYAPKVAEWQREMNEAFKGTKYASKPRHAKKHK